MRQREIASRLDKTLSLNRLDRASEKLAIYCKDIDRWPRSWAGFPELDGPVGERMVEEFKPFLLALIQERRTKKTVKQYAHYLWILGGEIIRRVHFEEKDRKLPGRSLILKYIDSTGGPLWNDVRYEREHEAYDTVCRQLYQFLTGGND